MNEMNNNMPQLNPEGQKPQTALGTNSSPQPINVNASVNVNNSNPNPQNVSNVPTTSPAPNIQSSSSTVENVPSYPNHPTSNPTSPINADPGMNLANQFANNSVIQETNSSSSPSTTSESAVPNLEARSGMLSNVKVEGNSTNSGTGSPSSNGTPKKTKSPLLAIFVFLIIGGFIFGLPYINEYKQNQETKKQQAALEEQLRKEEEAQQQEEELRQEALEEEKKIKTSICTLPAADQVTFVVNQTQTFEYKEDKILTVSIATSRTYLQEDAEYEAMKLSCQTQADPLTTPSQDGYSVDCEIDNLTITLTESYDLETFQTFTTTTGETKVAPYRYQQSFSEVQKTLVANQTVCK